jgi:hypothetical protein
MKDWLKLKNYLHFSPKYERKDESFIRRYVSNSKLVKNHRFYPFIHHTIKESKYRRQRTNGLRDSLRSSKVKVREIFYANHLDTQVFAYYGSLISEQLEDIYKSNEELNKSVLSYRRIPFDKNRNKCNIDFANEVFEFIRCYPSQKFSVMCFDIKSFFDNLDHVILKKQWAKIFGGTNLSEDHYKVYRAITRYSFVEINDLVAEFSELNIKKVKYIKNKKLSSFCKSGQEFRDRVVKKGLINYNNYDHSNQKVRSYGIPQGSPISAVLSNLYLIDFDKVMSEKAQNMGGIYRRYSDDILLICRDENSAELEKLICDTISNDLKLLIQSDKTQKVVFERNTDGLNCFTIQNGHKLKLPLNYLGFEFDGIRVLLRQKSLSSYYRKLKRTIRRRAKYALYALIKNQNPLNKQRDAWIYRERIYKNKSHLGAKRKKIGDKVFWGNYLSYVSTASRIMNQRSLLRQVRNHWKIIEQEIRFFEQAYDLPKTPSRRKKKQN